MIFPLLLDLRDFPCSVGSGCLFHLLMKPQNVTLSALYRSVFFQGDD